MHENASTKNPHIKDGFGNTFMWQKIVNISNMHVS